MTTYHFGEPGRRGLWAHDGKGNRTFQGALDDPEMTKRVVRLLNAEESMEVYQGPGGDPLAWPTSDEMSTWKAKNAQTMREWGEKNIDPGSVNRCSWRDMTGGCDETPVGRWELRDPPPYFGPNIGPKVRWYCLTHGEPFEKVGWHRLFGEASKPNRADFQHHVAEAVTDAVAHGRKVSIHTPRLNGRSGYSKMWEDLTAAIIANEEKILYSNPWGEAYTTGTGQPIRVHKANECLMQGDEPCVIHRPSDHPMRDFKTHWRADRRLMERICPHGIGHPDPDSLAYLQRIGAQDDGTHGCDGCCHG